MIAASTTRMSSKGQVVIPDELRRRMKLAAGAQFVVVGEGDVVVLKVLATPSMKQFDGLIQKARRQARSAGMKKSDIAAALAEVRGRW